ncbi:glycoside hydrolase family 15 protein [Sandaracinus amylolyticus]|nr:glycoside hydrolase family 15 protein [Sandaracinus amylolyticus]
MASRIEDYGFIGDMKGSALVSRHADIDWLCVPRFDSEACLAALLGRDEHGRWALRPTSRVLETRQRYRGDTLVLETELECDEGVVRIVDFMTPTSDRSDVVRIVEGVRGAVTLEMVLDVRFGYGASLPWIRSYDRQVTLVAGPDSMHLRASVPLTSTRTRVSSIFTIRAGEQASFVATWAASDCAAPPPLDAGRALQETERFWLEWAGRCTYRGKWRDAVVRSLLTLKALTYAPTGGIVAAPTTSLPEEIGGVRNWDYRFCWLRDATLTLDALMIGGYSDEARAWRDWIARTVLGDLSRLQIMYGLAGERRLTEFELDWLPGYEESRPVRVGNGAWNQFQLDVYGETLSCLYQARRAGLSALEEAWDIAHELLERIESIWQKPDEGIWEVRGGGLRHFTHSKVMAWVAIDRAIRLIEEFGVGGERGANDLAHLRALRERIHEDVCTRAWNEGIGAFAQSYGSDALDASVLIIPHCGFLPADDPRMLSTVRAIEKRLVRGGFVQRYSTELGLDGLPGDESPFLACSFWLADNYAFQGRIAEAEELFERLLAIQNHLGLLAEEYDPNAGRQIGNFPQAFSHLALIFTANAIETCRAKKTTRAQPAPQPAHP